ncbi:MAG: hypothetical protein JXA15_10725 [Spirochaetales bacterium]|nr:hypothetical protein [Spirochaetales bacterium]
MKPSRIGAATAVLLCLAFAPPPLLAQDSGDPGAGEGSGEAGPALRAAGKLDETVLVAAATAREGDAGSFLSSLSTAFVAELSARGIASRNAESPASIEADQHEPTRAAEFAREAACFVVALVDARMEGTRVAWRIAVYDARDGAMLGGDAWSAYAGLSALKLIEDSAASGAAELARALEAGLPPPRLSAPLRFSSVDEGALVSLGGGSAGASLPLGVIEDGLLVAPYLPLRVGERADFTVEREGSYPVNFTVRPRDDGSTVALPRLVPRSEGSFVLSTGRGRMSGLGFEYRPALVPDFAFLRLDTALFALARYGLKGAPWIWELRAGAGLYLTPPGWSFRLGAATGLASMFTFVADGKPYVDLALDTFSLLLEYHRGRYAFGLETRIPYSLGLASGLIQQGWMDEGGPLILGSVAWKY